MFKQLTPVLKESSLFKGINSENLNIMLGCLNPDIKNYKYREIIALNGSIFNGIGVVVSGKVALTKETYAGNRIILGILDPGDIFGEMVAFSNQHLWPVTVIAQDDCSLLFLPAEKVVGNCSNICQSHSILIRNILNILSNKALSLNRNIEHLSARSVRGKISSYLLDLYQQLGNRDFVMPMKRHELD